MNQVLKRSVALVAMLALLLSALCIPTALASGTKTYYATAKCYMRAAPDKSATKLATLRAGTKIKATDFEYDSRGVMWVYGSYDSECGWVSTKNLSTHEPKPTKSPAKAKKYVIITGSCNIRLSPSLHGEKVGSAEKGMYFHGEGTAVDDRGVTWYKIVYGSYGSAYVSSKYAKSSNSKPSSDPTVKPTAKPTAKPIDYSSFKAAEYYVQVTSTTLNMRYEPSSSSSKLGVYNYGDVLYALRVNKDWYQVLDESRNRSGYMAAKYLVRYEEPTATEDPEIESSTTGIVNSINELEAAVPNAYLVDAPEGSSNVEYSWNYIGVQDTVVAQIRFDYEGVTYTLRAARCADVDSQIDISEQTIAMQPETTDAADLHLVFSVDGTTAFAHYYSEEAHTQYCLSGPAVMGGVAVLNMANTLITLGTESAEI